MDRAAFWKANHLAADPFWLTGSSLNDLLAAYKLPAPEGLDVTEIGVGIGHATRALAQANRVTAVDVVEEALYPLAATARTLLTGDLQKAAPADLAFCHLVFQHCDTETVGRLLRAPLKPGGTFAFQTAYLLDPLTDGEGWDPLRVVWHPRDEVLALAEAAGLVPFWEESTMHPCDGVAVGWSCFKARRA